MYIKRLSSVLSSAMSLPLANAQDDSTTVSAILREVPGRGWQRRALILDASSGKPICQRIGGLPYARPLTPADRFRRGKPLPSGFQYGSKDNPTDCTGLAFECPQAKPYPSMREDCLQMNIWIPEGQSPPGGGWPVFFYIFGGFLQVGSPNGEGPVNLYRYSSYRAIYVSFTYRLNALGFLAAQELIDVDSVTGNVGLWDQRLALEFVAAEISNYGGNPKNITIGGLSAGAYSTFHQLAYSLSLPVQDAHIRRVVMWSNGCGLQPKTVKDAQVGFDQLIAALNISKSLSAAEKVARLRATPWKELIAAVEKVPYNSFRAVTDGQFVRQTLFEELFSGSFAKQMKQRGIKMMIGDCRDEETAYRLIKPPNSFSTLLRRLEVEFRADLVQRVVKEYCLDRNLPKEYSTWQDLFGRIYSDLQVHMTERGLISALSPILPDDHIFRYRIETRAKMLDKVMSQSLGVTHGSCLCFWFMGHNFGMRDELSESDTKLAKDLVEPLAQFIRNGEPKWETSSIHQVRLLDGHGTRTVLDPWWDRCIPVWRRIHGLDRQRL